MNELKKDEKMTELLRVIKGSIGDARSTVQELAQIFKDNVRMLRIEGSGDVFQRLLQNVTDLQDVMNFIGELREGMKHFDEFGMPADPVSDGNAGINIFREMNSAFATRDWIMLSDLIEYELHPLLIREDEWLGLLDGKLAECAA
ncbi:MAG: hypothetical protein HZA16_14280 [Nitrospirae bacterium]|nr:hypothetical protein [Nitrospirota bacterium]